MILVIKHIDIEGPGTMGDFLKEKGFHLMTIDLDKGQKLPSSVDGLEAVITLGGPMNVYEEARYPYLKEENEFIKKVLDKQIPFVGICLGSQLLAKACEAKVKKSSKKEIGFSTVELTKEGQKDLLFEGLGGEIDVFQWHEDMFEIPEGATHLAVSKDCPHQAFKIGPSAYGLQFHVEVTDKSIRDWSHAYFKANDETQLQKAQDMLKQYAAKKLRFNNIADKIYENFLKVISRKEASV